MHRSSSRRGPPAPRHRSPSGRSPRRRDAGRSTSCRGCGHRLILERIDSIDTSSVEPGVAGVTAARNQTVGPCRHEHPSDRRRAPCRQPHRGRLLHRRGRSGDATTERPPGGPRPSSTSAPASRSRSRISRATSWSSSRWPSGARRARSSRPRWPKRSIDSTARTSPTSASTSTPTSVPPTSPSTPIDPATTGRSPSRPPTSPDRSHRPSATRCSPRRRRRSSSSPRSGEVVDHHFGIRNAGQLVEQFGAHLP